MEKVIWRDCGGVLRVLQLLTHAEIDRRHSIPRAAHHGSAGHGDANVVFLAGLLALGNRGIDGDGTVAVASELSSK